MGCDIHMYAEVKIRDEWQAVGRVFTYGYHRNESPTIVSWYEDEGEWESNAILTVHPYNDRNYHLFAILAGVRNSDCLKPISEPRESLMTQVNSSNIQVMNTALTDTAIAGSA